MLERRRKESARTNLALYSIYLADFRIPRQELKGVGFGQVPAKENGTFAPLSLTVVDSDNDDLQGHTDVKGRVKILALDENMICVDVDLEFLFSGTLVTAARGIVAAPVVKAGRGFYFT